MGLTCNIDRRGQRVRAAIGVVLIVLAITALLGLGERDWVRVTSIVAGVLGFFALFEAANGWCALRALGVRTWL